MLFDGRLVKLIRLAFNNFKGAPGTLTQAGPQSIAIYLRYQFSLAIHDLNGAFGAGGNA